MKTKKKPDHRDALGLAIERGIIDEANGEVWAFGNANPIPALPEAWKPRLICQQGFRPEFLELEQTGYTVFPVFEEPEEAIHNAMFLCSRNRKWNEQEISSLWNRLKVGGRLVVAGTTNDGVKSMRKWMNKKIGSGDSFSKYHSIVFWVDKQDDHPDLPVASDLKSVEEYQLCEGVFSSDGPDRGSQLLAGHFDERIRGKVADLGAGWGYLSGELLKASGRIEVLDLFEANHQALKLAEHNTKQIADSLERDVAVSCHWCDVTSEFRKKPYDWVIMNPPFHEGRAATPELGKQFINTAASTLPSGGKLLMVANINLPYENTLEDKFRKVVRLDERDGFKLIEAIK